MKIEEKYKSPDTYIMYELKQAHIRIEQLENNLDEVVKKLRSAECQLINQNNYIIELEAKLNIMDDCDV
ncbi:MAG: hypothetical protein V8R64_16445 [Thomasclavelia sp.]